MNKENIQRFELADLLLQYDFLSYTLLCKSSADGKNLWIRKIEDGGGILDADEDQNRIFISMSSGDKSGQFIALNKRDGLTEWFIPGKAYMFRLYLNSVYLIFVDGDDNFFLIKVSSEDGTKLWHHAVDNRLCAYNINNELVSLSYTDGRTEILSSDTGVVLS